jgi:hypothetical protein
MPNAYDYHMHVYEDRYPLAPTATMAKVLAAKGYHYQFLFARNAKHVDRPTVAQTLPAALEWLWKGYPIP